jgi:hypothetical protein
MCSRTRSSRAKTEHRVRRRVLTGAPEEIRTPDPQIRLVPGAQLEHAKEMFRNLPFFISVSGVTDKEMCLSLSVFRIDLISKCLLRVSSYFAI